MSFTEIRLPSFDVNDTQATITEIPIEDCVNVKKGDILFVAENTKAVNEILSESDGFLVSLCAKFDVRRTGDVIGLLFDTKEEACAFDKKSYYTVQDASTSEINATKKAIDLAKELHVNLEEVADFVGGKIIKVKDVQEYHDKQIKVVHAAMKHVFKYDRERVVIIGAGKGAEVVIDILRDELNKEIVGLVDDFNKEMNNYDYRVLSCDVTTFPDLIDRKLYDSVIISIGATLRSMQLRNRIFDDYISKGIPFTNAIAKSAEIRRGVKLGVGNVIGAKCYIGTLTEIGNNNSISYGSMIGHHNIIGNGNLIAPGVITSGSVEIGNGCIIPAGVVTRNRVSIGDDVVLPIGYHIVNSIASGTIIQEKISNEI